MGSCPKRFPTFYIYSFLCETCYVCIWNFTWLTSVFFNSYHPGSIFKPYSPKHLWLFSDYFYEKLIMKVLRNTESSLSTGSSYISMSWQWMNSNYWLYLFNLTLVRKDLEFHYGSYTSTTFLSFSEGNFTQAKKTVWALHFFSSLR